MVVIVVIMLGHSLQLPAASSQTELTVALSLAQLGRWWTTAKQKYIH